MKMNMINKNTVTTYTIMEVSLNEEQLRDLRKEIDSILIKPKTKSVKDAYFELYNRLPKWIAERAKANFDDSYVSDYSLPSSLCNAILAGFYWTTAQEGHDFWIHVQYWLKGIKPHPPFPPEFTKPREDAVYLGKGGEFKTYGDEFLGWLCENKNDPWGNAAYPICWIDADHHYCAPADSEIVKLNYGTPPK